MSFFYLTFCYCFQIVISLPIYCFIPPIVVLVCFCIWMKAKPCSSKGPLYYFITASFGGVGGGLSGPVCAEYILFPSPFIIVHQLSMRTMFRLRALASQHCCLSLCVGIFFVFCCVETRASWDPRLAWERRSFYSMNEQIWNEVLHYNLRVELW